MENSNRVRESGVFCQLCYVRALRHKPMNSEAVSEWIQRQW